MQFIRKNAQISKLQVTKKSYRSSTTSLNNKWTEILHHPIPLYGCKVFFAALRIWLHWLVTRLPPCWAYFIWVLLNILQCLSHETKLIITLSSRLSNDSIILAPRYVYYLKCPQCFINTSANCKIINGGVLNNSFLVNDKKSSQCNSLKQHKKHQGADSNKALLSCLFWNDEPIWKIQRKYLLKDISNAHHK